MTDLLNHRNPEPNILDVDAPAARPADIVSPSERIDATMGSSLVVADAPADGGIAMLVPPSGRIVVVVPHPDDEVHATGGLIVHQRIRGREVVVVAVTDGHVPAPERNRFGRARRREQLDALERLGVGRRSVHRLEIPHGEVSRHLADLSACVAELTTADDVIVAPALSDRDADHGACGRAAMAVAARVGCDLLGSLSPTCRAPAFRPPGSCLAALALTDDELASRRAASACHRSGPCWTGGRTASGVQLPADVRDALERPVEFYLVGAPTYLPS